MNLLRRMLEQGDDGFTIVEVMVAAVLLVVGVTGTLTMINVAADRTTVNQGREAATNLAREIVEGAGNVSYDQITAGNVTTALKAQPNLGSPGAGWSLSRRGVTYAVSATACTIDDRVDGFGTAAAKSAGGWCADSAATGSGTTADRNPDDMRRVAVTVTWTAKGQTRTVRQAAVFFNPGNAVGPQVTSLTPDVAPPALTPTGTVTFSASAAPSATHVKFWVDGVLKADVTAKTGAVWNFPWPTEGLRDATYVIAAQAYDAQDRTRGAYTTTYQIDRNPASPPSAFTGGRNLRLIQAGSSSNSIVDLDWLASTDGDVFGYRVYRSDGSKACEVTRETANDITECSDLTPLTATTSTYGVVALDRNAAGGIRESSKVTLTFTTDNDRPGQPASVSAGYTPEGNVTLTWAAASPGKKRAEPVAFYRIYKDGELVSHRAGRTTGPTCPADCKWTAPSVDPDGKTHVWRVAAVDSKYGEGDPGPDAGIVK